MLSTRLFALRSTVNGKAMQLLRGMSKNVMDPSFNGNWRKYLVLDWCSRCLVFLAKQVMKFEPEATIELKRRCNVR